MFINDTDELKKKIAAVKDVNKFIKDNEESFHHYTLKEYFCYLFEKKNYRYHEL